MGVNKRGKKPTKINILSWSSKERASYLIEVLIMYFPTIF